MIARIYYFFGFVSFVFLIVYYFFLEEPFFSYINLPFAVLSVSADPNQITRIKAGDAVPMLVRRCNSSRVTHVYTLSHSLVRMDRSTAEVILPASITSISPGCSEILRRDTIVPPDTAPGLYQITGVAEVQATIRSVTVTWQSQPFEVTP